MKKALLLSSLSILAGLSMASAENKAYVGVELGEVNGVSSNGKYVSINDPDNNCVYLWNVENPDLFTEITPEFGDLSTPSGQRVNGANGYSVSDNGIVAGCINYADGKSVPAYYKNGEWIALEMPANVLNTNVATVVTPDAKTIAGYCCHAYKDADGTYFGQYFPVRWDLDEEGDYVMTSYEDIDLLNHDGFFPMCISADGKIIGGRLDAGFNSSMEALLMDGQLKYFHKIEIGYSPLIYKGEYYCGRDENGVQIWTTDPNDPRIVLYESTLIDGMVNDSDTNSVTGFFASCDNQGNFYGCRSIVSNVNSDGTSATVKRPACIYNVYTEEWTNNLKYDAFTCGSGKDVVFTTDDHVLFDDDPYTLDAAYHCDVPAVSFGVSKCNNDATVLGCVRGEFNEAILDWDYYPYVIVTEEYSGVNTIYGGEDRATIYLHGNTIEVRNAEKASLYDLDGRMLGEGLSFTPGAGTYVVKANEISAKVIIK